MDPQTIFATLRDTLATLYPETADARLIVNDAGLDASAIAFSERTQTNWHNILIAALNQNRLDALLQVVQRAYPTNPPFQAAYAQYARFVAQGGHLAAPPPLATASEAAPAIDTAGGTYIGGNVTADAGDIIARDQQIAGDKMGGDKITGTVGPIGDHSTVVIGKDIQVTITERLTGLDPTADPAPGEPPYQGLEYYGVADAPRFFGRERLTAELTAYLRHHHFLAVIGASGSGKSSLVRAGLVPALQRNEPLTDGLLPPVGSSRWPVHIITPKAHPLEQLAATLTHGSESVTAQATLMDDLAKDTRSLHLYATRLASAAGANRLLLVVDQFEEIFTLCREPAERKNFINNLLVAAVNDGSTTVVITLRADFYHRCADFAGLRQALEHYQKYIGPMSADELHRAIEAPARLGRWELEPGLIDLLLTDVVAQPGALPLLSHALLETWRRRRGRILTLAGYAASGRVQGAIAQTAEAVLNGALTPNQRLIARTIFVRLTELGEGVQDTRRRVGLSELLPEGEGAEAVQIVLNALAHARLITTDQDPTTGQEEVEVAHEALIREWATLRDWLQDDREGLRIHRHLTEAAGAWLTLNQDPGELYRGTRLDQASAWAQTHTADLNEQEQTFLDASLAERQRTTDDRLRIEREREAARVLQLKHTQTSRNRARLAAAASLLALVFAASVAWILYQQNFELQGARWLSEANALRTARDVDGAIAKYQAAATADPTLGIDVTWEISETRRYAALELVYEGEQLAARGDRAGAKRKFEAALVLQPPADTPIYVWIEAGNFLMGSSEHDILARNDEKPQHEVYLDGYWIMRTEVTNEQYAKCIAVGVCTEPNNQRWYRAEYTRNPVTDIKWTQATVYAHWVGGRLPTEAEWEKACRGVNGYIYSWGNETPNTQLLNYSASGLNGVINVGSYPPGILGLHDMLGNVWEWTGMNDTNPNPHISPQRDPQVRICCDVHTLRGGSFNATINLVRCAVRTEEGILPRDDYIGFRIVSPGF